MFTDGERAFSAWRIVYLLVMISLIGLTRARIWGADRHVVSVPSLNINLNLTLFF